MSDTRLIPIPDWQTYHAWPSEKALRTYVARADSGELASFRPVIKRIGRRILIDERAFFAWVEGEQK